MLQIDEQRKKEAVKVNHIFILARIAKSIASVCVVIYPFAYLFASDAADAASPSINVCAMVDAIKKAESDPDDASGLCEQMKKKKRLEKY